MKYKVVLLLQLLIVSGYSQSSQDYFNKERVVKAKIVEVKKQTTKSAEVAQNKPTVALDTPTQTNLNLDPGMVLNTALGNLRNFKFNPAINLQASSKFNKTYKYGSIYGALNLILASNDEKDRSAIFNPIASSFGLLMNFNYAFLEKYKIPIVVFGKCNYQVKRFSLDSVNTFNPALFNYGMGIEFVLSKKYLSVFGAYDEYRVIQGVSDFQKFQSDDRLKYDNLSFGLVANLEFENDLSNRIQLKLHFIPVNSRNNILLNTEDLFLVFMDLKYVKKFIL